MTVKQEGDLRRYELVSNARLRDDRPPDKLVTFSESPVHAIVRTGNLMFDGLYAMAVDEARQNSVSQIKDGAYNHGLPIKLEAYQTGEFWTYVWTRDLSYSVNLALAGFDPERAVSSLLFKTSTLKPSVSGGFTNQIIQDTGSGGSYPVSSDRIVWALGASETLKYLSGPKRQSFLDRVYPVLCDTIEQDRRLVYDPQDGLYRGEQSFLDWREQTYPDWTKDNALPIAMSKALSVNAANFFLLQTAAEYAKLLGRKAESLRYAGWAGNLKTAINEHFYDPHAGLYCSYLLSDGLHEIRVDRYDLLGESLAVLLGVADHKQAVAILSHYPVGPYGPPVVWPQERTVPIYHNQAIWPFVTAYWIKAAQKTGNAEAVDLGVHSLERGAAFNLSNMENFDLVTGQPEVKGKALNGPVINSRRQLWSVAAYLSMVQDVVFGLETSWEGIRFRPYITAEMRNDIFASCENIELRNFSYRNTRNLVRVHLPATNSLAQGRCPIVKIELNGRKIGDKFASLDSLQSSNRWDIYLAEPRQQKLGGSLRLIDVTKERTRFGPAQPEWAGAGQGGITLEHGRPVLHYRHSDVSNVVFNIYRDGVLCAKAIRETDWVDATSNDGHEKMHSYAVTAVDPVSGNASHLTPPRCYFTDNQLQEIPAKDMQNRGGNLVAGDHFENWGKSEDSLLIQKFSVHYSGQYILRAKFSNGSGPVNTGVTCAVKKLEVSDRTGMMVAGGYLVMPQSGNWQRWDLSSPVRANLNAGEEYSIRLSEDGVSRNMSYQKNNESYTAWAGGGETSYNFVNIASVLLQPELMNR